MSIKKTLALIFIALLSQTTLFALTYVKMETTRGDVYLELDEEKAPITVKNFVDYVEDEFYNGTTFHRVIKGFMIQGGGFTGTQYSSQKKTKAQISNEADNGLKNEYGTIAMARTPMPHSATSQFFINTADNTFLNFQGKEDSKYGYCVFGKVIAGMSTIDKIENSPVKKGQVSTHIPKTTVYISEMKVVRPKSKDLQALKSIDDKYFAEKKAEEEKLKKVQEEVKTQALNFYKEVMAGNENFGFKTKSGLRYIILKKGTGTQPSKTSTVKVHYSGWLKNGTQFDSSRARGTVTEFPLNRVISGWTEGVALMKTGGHYIFIIPPSLGYGARDLGTIPPNSTLIFEIELLQVK